MQKNKRRVRKGDDNMRELICKSCGATKLQIRGNYALCDYCDSKFLLTAEDFSIYSDSKSPSTLGQHQICSKGIALGNDVTILLQKCRLNPQNARKYANLILDIDPDNEEALKYL